jgi:D-serine deaminase-like pyridoxal phosphate-dependent protein
MSNFVDDLRATAKMSQDSNIANTLRSAASRIEALEAAAIMTYQRVVIQGEELVELMKAKKALESSNKTKQAQIEFLQDGITALNSQHNTALREAGTYNKPEDKLEFNAEYAKKVAKSISALQDEVAMLKIALEETYASHAKIRKESVKAFQEVLAKQRLEIAVDYSISCSSSLSKEQVAILIKLYGIAVTDEQSSTPDDIIDSFKFK